MFRNVYRKLEQSGEDRSLPREWGADTQENIQTSGPQMASEVSGIAQGVMGLGKGEDRGKGTPKGGQRP